MRLSYGKRKLIGLAMAGVIVLCFGLFGQHGGTLAIALLFPVWATWGIRLSLREGAVTYKGRTSNRSEEPVLFWMALGLMALFGYLAPLVLAISERDRLFEILGIG